jgi:hypothetical protein
MTQLVVTTSRKCVAVHGGNGTRTITITATREHMAADIQESVAKKLKDWGFEFTAREKAPA